MQPHLTGLLPQQSKRVSDLQPVDKYNMSKGSISANMNSNYFSSNKSYPEPKIIEYDMEETSTESSPQHTSSLYSESTTDQDSESVHPSNVFSRNTLGKSIECHVTKESKTIMSLSQDFPVPSQFADLSLNRDDVIDDHQHSILHSAYNQDDDIEDIPLSDNINQNKIEHTLGNHVNHESQLNEQVFNTSRVQTFDYYANKKDFGQTEFNYENNQDQAHMFNSNTNFSTYNLNPLNIQNSPHSVKEYYLNQSNTLAQPNSLNSSILQPPKSLPVLPYDNTEQSQKKSAPIQHFNENLHPIDYNQQNKHVQPVFKNVNAPPTNSNLHPSVVNSNTQDGKMFNQSTSSDQTLHDQNSCQSMQSSINNLHHPQNVTIVESINQQSMFNPSKSSASDFLNNSTPTTNHQFATDNLTLISTQSVGLITSADITSTTERNLSSAPQKKVGENQNTLFQAYDEHASCSLNSSNVAINSSTDLVNQESTNTAQSEFGVKPLQSPSNIISGNQQDNVKSLSPTPVVNFTQSNNNLSPADTVSDQKSNYQQSSQNQFTSQQSTFDVNIKSPIDLVSNTVNNQNANVQQFKPMTCHSTSHYFDSTNENNKSVFNQQSHSQHETIHTQNVKPIISNFSSSSKNNDSVVFSNLQNNAANCLSSNQQPSPVENNLQVNDSLELDSNISPIETVELNSAKSIQFQSNDSHVNSIKNTDNIVPNDQFSNMTIDNQQDLPVNQPTKQVHLTSGSYFSKETSFDSKESFGEFPNFNTLVNDIGNSSSTLSEVNNIPQSANKQIDSLYLNPNQSAPNMIPQLPLNTSTELDVKTVEQPIANPLPPQELSNKLTDNVISSSTNQFTPKMFSNKPKLDNVSCFKTITNPCLTQSVNNQQISTAAPILNQCPPQMFTNQQKSDTIPSLQPISNPYSTQSVTNQPSPTVVPTVSSAVTQFPPQMFSNQPKLDSISALQSSTNLYSTQKINNQQTPNEVPPVTQFPPQIYSNQPKSVVMPMPLPNSSNHNLIKTVNSSLTVQSASSATNQFPPQTFNDQAKLGTTAHPQPGSSQYSTQSFSNQLSVNPVLPKLPTGSQLPPQMFSNQSKSDVTPIQTTSSIFSSQPFNNQSRSNMVPPVPATVNQFPSQMLSNQPKSHVAPLQSSQYQSQPYNSQPRMNMIPSVPSTTNQFPQQMLSNQPRLDTGLPNKITANRYPSQPQPLNNHPVPGVPPIQQSTTQYLSQPFSNQSKANVFPPQTGTNQYPPQPSPGNQIYNQTNSAQAAHNQWPLHQSINQSSLQLTTPISNQANPMFSHPNTNLSSTLPSMPPSMNQQSQRLGSQVYPSNTLSSSNYCNLGQGNENVQQSLPPTILQGQNVQLPSKGYPLQGNISLSSQINHQQPNTNLGQQGFHNQQQAPYKTEQNSATVQQGFAKTWVSLLLLTI